MEIVRAFGINKISRSVMSSYTGKKGRTDFLRLLSRICTGISVNKSHMAKLIGKILICLFIL